MQTLTRRGVGDAAAGLGVHFLHMSESSNSHDAGHLLFHILLKDLLCIIICCYFLTADMMCSFESPVFVVSSFFPVKSSRLAPIWQFICKRFWFPQDLHLISHLISVFAETIEMRAFYDLIWRILNENIVIRVPGNHKMEIIIWNYDFTSCTSTTYIFRWYV